MKQYKCKNCKRESQQEDNINYLFCPCGNYAEEIINGEVKKDEEE